MIQFGQELRQEREDRGVSVDAICAVTKVSPRHVEALEAGHYAELPGGVFRKGIVRSYISALGLEEAVWIQRFDISLREQIVDSSREQDWAAFAENVSRNRGAGGRSSGLRWLGVALMLIALVVCGLLTWQYVLRSRFTL